MKLTALQPKQEIIVHDILQLRNMIGSKYKALTACQDHRDLPHLFKKIIHSNRYPVRTRGRDNLLLLEKDLMLLHGYVELLLRSYYELGLKEREKLASKITTLSLAIEKKLG